jgi:hypothetical protein
MAVVLFHFLGKDLVDRVGQEGIDVILWGAVPVSMVEGEWMWRNCS